MSTYHAVSGNLDITGRQLKPAAIISELLLETLREADALGLGHAKSEVNADGSSFFASTTGYPEIVEFKQDAEAIVTDRMEVRVTIIIAGEGVEKLKQAYLRTLDRLASKYDLEIGGQKIVEHHHHR